MKKEEEMVKELIKDVNKHTKEQWEEVIEEAKEKSSKFFSQWCYVQQEMEKRRNCVMEIQSSLRSGGYDVKIDMQNYELSYYGKIKEEK